MTSRLSLFALSSIIVLSFAHSAIAKDVVSPVSLLLKEKSKSSAFQQKRNVRNERGIDEIDLDLKADKARCEEIEKVLLENYGPAKFTRRNLRIWELPNTNKSNGQSKMITIMAGEENGRYFVKLDRKGASRGNNPRLNKALQQRESSRHTSPATKPKSHLNTRD